MIRRSATLLVYLATLLSPLFLELQYQSNPRLEAGILLLFALSFFAIVALFLFCIAPLVFGFRANDRIGSHPYARVAAAAFMFAFSFEFLLKGDTVRHSYPFRIAYTSGDVITGYPQFQELLLRRIAKHSNICWHSSEIEVHRRIRVADRTHRILTRRGDCHSRCPN